MPVTPSQLRADTQEYKDEIGRRVDTVFEADGYTRPDEDGLPQRDHSLVRVKMATTAGQALVDSKKERYTKAMRFVDFVTTAFPNAPSPSVSEQIEDDDERLYAEAVWSKIVGLVESQSKTIAFERLIEETYGRTFCTVELHPDDVPTKCIYITADLGCILQDGHGPLAASLRSSHQNYTKKMERIVKRHPEHGKRLIAEFRKVATKMVETSTDQMQLALEMTTNGAESDDDDE